jgi:hypothetical protein
MSRQGIANIGYIYYISEEDLEKIFAGCIYVLSEMRRNGEC